MPKHVVWFRKDLRLHDHRPLCRAIDAAAERSEELLLVYVVDPRHFGQTRFGFERVSPIRRRFLAESVESLQHRVAAFGLTLQLHVGYPEVILPQLCHDAPNSSVYFHHEIGTEESDVETLVRSAVEAISCRVEVSSPNTMLNFEDLPFEPHEAPEVFTQFRCKVERTTDVREPLPVPVDVLAELGQRSGCHPPRQTLSVKDIDLLQYETISADSRAVLNFIGGESEALNRVQEYVWDRDHLRRYKETRNGMLGPDYSSKFSPWLALGCVSARQIYSEVKRYEEQRIRNDSTYWLIFELLWRDYFALMAEKHGANLFRVGGLRGTELPWSRDSELFARWTSGTTGYPLIDANMRELQLTGWMSNRGRQNVASFLTRNLGIDWRMGAEWFESRLIDYDPCSNYGNWNYNAGVGNDARGFRWFNTIKQSQDYDRDGSYVRHWLPQLAACPGSHSLLLPMASEISNFSVADRPGRRCCFPVWKMEQPR
ncbi:MAG: DASH family cryptochrome, partial [Fuerstiella sp.]